MDRSAQQSANVISDAAVVQPRRRRPSTPRQAAAADLAAAAAAVASYRFTVGPDEAFPLPPSPLVKPKTSTCGQYHQTHIYIKALLRQAPLSSMSCKTISLIGLDERRDMFLSSVFVTSIGYHLK